MAPIFFCSAPTALRTVQTTARKNPERGNSDPVISSSLYTKVYFDEFFRPGKKIIKRRGTYLKIELDA